MTEWCLIRSAVQICELKNVIIYDVLIYRYCDKLCNMFASVCKSMTRVMNSALHVRAKKYMSGLVKLNFLKDTHCVCLSFRCACSRSHFIQISSNFMLKNTHRSLSVLCSTNWIK